MCAWIVCGVLDPFLVCLERIDQVLCEVPDLIVLSGVEGGGGNQSDAEKGSVCVVIKCCGLWVVVVGRVGVGDGQKLL